MNWLKSLKGFFQESDGSLSWGRGAATVTTIVACFCLIFVTVKTHTIPDVATLGGLAAFAISGYGVNKGFTALGKKDNL